MLSCGQALRSCGPSVWPRLSLCVRLVHALIVLVSMGVSSFTSVLCRTCPPNSHTPRVFYPCLRLISSQQRSARSRNTRRRAHRSHTFACLWDECPRVYIFIPIWSICIHVMFTVCIYACMNLHISRQAPKKRLHHPLAWFCHGLFTNFIPFQSSMCGAPHLQVGLFFKKSTTFHHQYP
jgi:hypothetical protein